MIAYVKNVPLMLESHAKKINYWEMYIEEILHEIGADFEPIDASAIGDGGILHPYSAVIVGAQSGQRLDQNARHELARYTEDGGLLIGFMTKGLDELFGIETFGKRSESDPYEVSAYFEFFPHYLTRNIHPHTFIEQKLLVFSDIAYARCEDAEQIACLYDDTKDDNAYTAVSWRAFGNGHSAYFAFDVPKTVWVLHQGRPLYTEKQNQFFPRPSDGYVLGNNSGKVPYADEIVYILQNMLAEAGEAFVYTLPPCKNEVPDAAIIWGGDEYFGPTRWSLFASDFMKSLDLPYHINIESENHPMTKDEFEHITRINGHEISLYILLDDQDHISAERIKEQRDCLVERFGIEPGCCLFNVVRWYGWAEPARYLFESGGTSVHSKLPGSKNLEHPLANAPAFAMMAGTANPFHYYDNAEYENAFIPCVEIPVVGYELGHNGSVGVMIEVNRDGNEHLGANTAQYHPGDNQSMNYDDVHLPIDMAIKYHTLSHFFYHPTYIEECPNAREAIRHILSYISFLKAKIYHMANNQAANWWNERRGAKAKTTNVSENKDRIVTSGCDSFGLIAKMPVTRQISSVTVNGKPAGYRVIQDFGRDWIHVIFPPNGGECEISYR
jgi:hypothetical protein